jgi:hypothetical protein
MRESLRGLSLATFALPSGAITLSVLRRWKMAAVYCRAVLSRDQRITLDGTPAETVDAEAKTGADRGA